MTRRDRFTDELEVFLDEYEGPPQLPDDVRDAIVAELPNTKQSGRLGLRRYPGTAPLITTRVQYGLAAAIGGLALLGAALFVGGQGIGGPIASPSASPTPTATPREAVAFFHPFTYMIDASSGLELPAFDSTIYNFRVPAEPPGEGYDEGVIVHAGGDGLRTDVCNPTGGEVNEDPTPQEVMDVVTSLDGIELSTPEETTVDGRPALAITVDGDENRRCDYHVFENFQPPFASGESEGRTRRIILTEVDGDLVVIAITASNEKFETWLPTAEEFVDSMSFTGRSD